MDELLKMLRKNALEAPADMAKMLGISEDEVRGRVAKYEADGIIRGYQAIINEQGLDLTDVSAAIEVKITPERGRGFDQVATRIGKYPEVVSLYLMSGAYDLLAIVHGQGLKEVALFVNEKLATIDGVISTATHFMLKAYKEQGVLMQVEEEDERLKVSP